MAVRFNRLARGCGWIDRGSRQQPLWDFYNGKRVLVTGGRPVTYLIDILPKGILPSTDFGDEFQGSVLDLILQRGEPSLGHSRTEITAISAPAHIAKKLQISRNEVLLVLEAWLITAEGKAIDHSLSYFLPGIFRFHVVRRVGQP